MTEWPKNPQLQVGGALEPAGPVNVFNEKVATAEAINRAIATKTTYDATHPAVPPPEVIPPPPGIPISAGGPIDTPIDGVKYMLDISTAAARRRR
jgi:hypothetical protein